MSLASKRNRIERDAGERALDDLPMLPSVVARLLALDPRSDEFFAEVLELGTDDPPFAAKVIQAANAAHSAPIQPIEGLRDAVMRLGAKSIADLVTSVAVSRVFVPSTAGECDLWRHSLLVAVLAREITQLIANEPDGGLEEAYLGGLVHDLGRFLMLDTAPDELDAVEQKGWRTPEELIEKESGLFGLDHARLGARAMRKWGLPPSLCDLVEHHHVYDPDEIPVDTEFTRATLVCVQLADRLACCLAGDLELAALPAEDRAEWIADNCIHESWKGIVPEADEIVGVLDEACDEAASRYASLGMPAEPRK